MELGRGAARHLPGGIDAGQRTGGNGAGFCRLEVRGRAEMPPGFCRAGGSAAGESAGGNSAGIPARFRRQRTAQGRNAGLRAGWIWGRRTGMMQEGMMLRFDLKRGRAQEGQGRAGSFWRVSWNGSLRQHDCLVFESGGTGKGETVYDCKYSGCRDRVTRGNSWCIKVWKKIRGLEER